MSNHGYGPRELDLDAPSAARAYDYYLGGAHNFEPDRRFADEVRAMVPWVANVAKLNRSFLQRVVRFYLDRGITQFIDLGSGIPTVGNVHEVAQARDPEAAVVYVDFEPVAWHSAQTMLADNPRATIIQADVRDPAAILGHPDTRRLIDFSRPVGLLVVGVLLFVGPEDRPAELVAAYRRELPPGSYLALSHLTDEDADPALRADVERLIALYRSANEHVHSRTREEFASWFEGTELVSPGVTFLPDWRPDSAEERDDVARPLGYGGVGRV